MFFILSKILHFLTHPFTWVLIGLGIAFFTKREKLKKWSFRAGLIILIFFSNTVIFLEFTRLWEPEGTSIEDVKHHDVAIVLGGMAEYDNNLGRLSIRRGGDRIWQAIHLYHLGKVDKIMIVGANGDLVDKGLNEALQFKEVLITEGIPENDIIVETESHNTYENAVNAKLILDEIDSLDSYLLVTSALHMNRSMACFEKAGFEEIDAFTTDHFTGSTRGYTFDQYIVPNASTMVCWSKLIHEWIGYVTYWMMGYI